MPGEEHVQNRDHAEQVSEDGDERRDEVRHQAARQEDKPFEQHPRSTDVHDPPRQQRLENPDPPVRLRPAQRRTPDLQREHGQSENGGLGEPVLVLAQPLIARSVEEVLKASDGVMEWWSGWVKRFFFHSTTQLLHHSTTLVAAMLHRRCCAPWRAA